jgi:two-component system nitrogen regulation response regulator GlnG
VGTLPLNFNVRVIAATHQNLEERVKTAASVKICFRTQCDSPASASLRERREDVFMLTRHFLQQSAKQLGVEPKRISDAAAAQQLRVPGNAAAENIATVGDGARRWWSPGLPRGAGMCLKRCGWQRHALPCPSSAAAYAGMPAPAAPEDPDAPVRPLARVQLLWNRACH